MKEKNEEVKKTIYAGMSIFDIIKDLEINMNKESISLEDKKYLSLYLGIINTKNEVSKYLEEKEIKFNFKINFKYLKKEKYLEIYNNYFVDVFNEVSFESIEENLNSLLNKKVVQDFNRCNGHYVNKTINERNKELIKIIN